MKRIIYVILASLVLTFCMPVRGGAAVTKDARGAQGLHQKKQKKEQRQEQKRQAKKHAKRA